MSFDSRAAKRIHPEFGGRRNHREGDAAWRAAAHLDPRPFRSQRRVRRRSRPAIPRNVSHVRPRRPKAIVMLISSKGLSTSLCCTDPPVDLRVAGRLLGLSYISVGRAQGSVICITHLALLLGFRTMIRDGSKRTRLNPKDGRLSRRKTRGSRTEGLEALAVVVCESLQVSMDASHERPFKGHRVFVGS